MDSLLVKALQKARDAATKVVERGVQKTSLSKGAYGDTTLEIDKRVEDAVVNFVRSELPDCVIISEEAGVIGRGSDRRVILLDPVDGSTNALMGIPIYSTTIALAEGGDFRDITAAGVIDLVRGEVFYGERGKGVRVDGKPSKPSGRTDIPRSVIGIDTRISISGGAATESAVHDLIKVVRYPRILGSAALEAAYVAIGRFDAFVEPIPRLRTFDCFPSLFLVKEAGGCFEILGEHKSDLPLRSSDRYAFVAAGNRELCLGLLDIFRKERSI